MPHPAPPRALVEAVRARYPLWQNLSLDHVAQARQHPLPWLLKTIEEMYDSRYAHDVAELEYIAGGDPDDADELIGAHPFPEYVQSYCGRQYGVKALAEKAAWEVMCNAEAARSAGTSTIPKFNRVNCVDRIHIPDHPPQRHPSERSFPPPSLPSRRFAHFRRLILRLLQPRVRRRGAHVLPLLPPDAAPGVFPSSASKRSYGSEGRG